MNLNNNNDFTMDDINTELNNILKAQRDRSPSKITYNSENLKSSMKVLSESFDTLNLPTFNWNYDVNDIEEQKVVLYEIVNSSLEFLKLYKSTQQKITSANCESICYKKSIEKLNDEIMALKKEIENKSKKINLLETEIFKVTSHLEDGKRVVNSAKVEKKLLQKRLCHKENQLLHSINEKKALSEDYTKKLKEGLDGAYKSFDKITAVKLLEYQKNEDMYRKVISKLERNNKALVNELLDLKEKILYNNSNE